MRSPTEWELELAGGAIHFSGNYGKAMCLASLGPRFVVVVELNKAHRYVDTLAEADGIMFLCPRCFETNKGPIGTHYIIVWFAGHVPGEIPLARWSVSGSDFNDLTLNPSILLPGEGCKWHGYVRDGAIVE